MRSSGVLLHPTSLPSAGGIGTLGAEAKAFIDWLAAAKQRWWQMLPLGPTGLGNSPYQCTSAFAGNPLLIDMDALRACGWLAPDDATPAEATASARPDAVDFDAVKAWKRPMLRRAFTGFQAHATEADRVAFATFCQAEAAWLEPFALFTAISEAHGARLFLEWPTPLKMRDPAALTDARARWAAEVEAARFEQFVFFRQLDALRAYAAQRGVKMIGDIPIFVALNSADVWARPELFQLDAHRNPTAVAGVPPDYFSDIGQLWGNPLYRWDALKAEGYAWWMARIHMALRTADLLRVDHFRGFEAYWSIPAGAKTAVTGRWVPGPGHDFFKRVKQVFGDIPIIAEDLGIITPPVEALRDDFHLPGMKILQFAFGDTAQNPYLPHNYKNPHCVVYTGTHDNDTTVGWFKKAPPQEAKQVRAYLGVDGSDIAWDLIRAAWGSRASAAIAPAQDLLSLGTEARMNIPGTVENNWRWRLAPGQLTDALAHKLAALTERAYRVVSGEHSAP
jgi:4-alpha-glucanotransferase